MVTTQAMPTGMTPSRVVSWLVSMTMIGLGTKARTMINSDRCRPRDASARSSSFRRASWSNCSSLSIAELQVCDRLRSFVENALDGGGVDTTTQIVDASHEPVENELQRGVRLLDRAPARIDPRKHDALVGEHSVTLCRHAIRRLPSA